jgi:GT2 family glycosyltransferase
VDLVAHVISETGGPTVSVLMPVWNAERFVAPAIESILSQTFTDFEFLIFDDGSTDRSVEIVSRYADRDSRIRLFPRPHVGYTRWLNEGLSLARGEFVARMDADDIALPSRLERQVDHLRRAGDCVAVGSSVYLIDSDAAPICEHRYDPDHESIDGGHIAGEFNMILHPACTFRRSALLAVGGYREEFHTAEDYDLFLRLAEVGRLANLPEILLHYRKHHGSVNVRQHLDQAHRGTRALEEARTRRGMPPVSHEVVVDPPSLAANHRKWALAAAGAGNRRTALKHAFLLLRQAPLAIRSWYVLLRCASPDRLTGVVRALLRARGTERAEVGASHGKS